MAAYVDFVVFYLYSTSNHNLSLCLPTIPPLSFISILHQTTTSSIDMRVRQRCLLSLFYIKPQLDSVFRKVKSRCLLSLFYIKPQHVCRVAKVNLSCLLSLFYIKPQLQTDNMKLIKVVFYLYSTSNHNVHECHLPVTFVVFYLYSTSNHN